jgi:HK97 family phage major capsid protein
MNELENKKMNVELEIRSLSDSIKAGTIKADAAKVKFEELRAQKTDIEKQIALSKAPVETRDNKQNMTFADIGKAMLEKRSITLSGVDSINQIKTLVKGISEKTDLLNTVSYFYGPNAQTNIPVLYPDISEPSAIDEGGTVSEDSTATIGNTVITPVTHAIELPVTWEALTLGAVDIESELPNIFQKAFTKIMLKGMLVGDGTGKNMAGIFGRDGANKVKIAKATSLPVMSDLVSFATTLAGLDDTYTIIMNPAVYSNIMASSDADPYKYGLINNKEIEGVKIVLSAKAPNSTTSGAIACAAIPLERYAIGVASDLEITPIRSKGSTTTTYQAIMSYNGKPVHEQDIYELVVSAA